MHTTLIDRIISRVRPAAPAAAHLRFTLYTRAGCTCCEKAKAVLEPRRRRHGFAVEEVDVDGDPALAEAHGASVPVVAVDGKVRFRGRVDPALLDRLLEAEANRAARDGSRGGR